MTQWSDELELKAQEIPRVISQTKEVIKYIKSHVNPILWTALCLLAGWIQWMLKRAGLEMIEANKLIGSTFSLFKFYVGHLFYTIYNLFPQNDRILSLYPRRGLLTPRIPCKKVDQIHWILIGLKIWCKLTCPLRLSVHRNPVQVSVIILSLKLWHYGKSCRRAWQIKWTCTACVLCLKGTPCDMLTGENRR